MTREEIDDFFNLTDMEKLYVFLKKMVSKYMPNNTEIDLRNIIEEDFEKINQIIKRILNQTEEELLDYFEEKCINNKDYIRYLEFLSDYRKIKILYNHEKIQRLDVRTISNLIRTIENDDEKIKVMQNIESLDVSSKVFIIRTIKDEDKRIQAMLMIEGLSSSNKAAEISRIEDDDKKINTMQSTEGLDVSSKVLIIRTIKDEDKRIQAMQTTEGLDGASKVSIIETIEDDDKKINALQTTQGLSEMEIITVLDSFSNETLKRTLLTANLPGNIWSIYRKRNSSNIDFIIDNIKLFIERETQLVIDNNGLKDILFRLYEKNSDVIKNIDFKILQQKYLDTLGEERINLISCYPDIQEAVINLSDEQLYLFDKCMDVFVSQNETDEWTVLAQELLSHIGEYDELIQSIENVKSLSIQDIIDLSRIMQSENWCEIHSIDQVKEYDTIKRKKCQEIMENENATLEEKKNAVFQKIFGHDISYSLQILSKYGDDIENIDEGSMKDYVRAIKLISEMHDVSVLQEVFEQCEYAILDKVSLERELKTAYLKKYLEGLYVVKQENDNQNETSNVYEAGTNFKMIITSVGAFSGQKHSQDYKDDWNRPAISTQHFCASYIRNDMIGTAPIRSICYGFSTMREDALMLSGPSDICSSRDKLVSAALHNEKYYTPDAQVDNTQRYNEMDFRRIQGGVKVQPDYIVVFRRNGQIDNMIEAQRASEQWGGMPIVVIDVDECLKAERAKVDEKIAQYKEKPTLELAREIIQKVRNNRVTDDSFCIDIETELSQLRAKVELHKTEKNNEYVESNVESNSKGLEIVHEEQLSEIYESVSANERKIGIGKIREIYIKVKKISKGGQDDGR